MPELAPTEPGGGGDRPEAAAPLLALARVTVRCSGRHCPFKSRVRTANRHGNVSLTKLFRTRLRSGVRLDVAITSPNTIGKVTRYRIRRGKLPRGQSLCVPVGQTRPQKRC